MYPYVLFTPPQFITRRSEKWKIYPTYDFACPVVDSIEGVTHALRTNEYRDRNPQYFWMIEALDIRPVNIWDFRWVLFLPSILVLTRRCLAVSTLFIPCSRRGRFIGLLTKASSVGGTTHGSLQSEVCLASMVGYQNHPFTLHIGILRRGMTVQALKEFMLSQGPSQAIVSLEWDSLWSLNKKIIDPIAPRFWAISKDKL